jgi:hypothetical protein
MATVVPPLLASRLQEITRRHRQSPDSRRSVVLSEIMRTVSSAWRGRRSSNSPYLVAFACCPTSSVTCCTASRRRTRPNICGCGIRRVWMHQSFAKGSSVSTEAVEYCRQHDISVIAGACPMMYGADVDFGHTCVRWILKLTGELPV